MLYLWFKLVKHVKQHQDCNSRFRINDEIGVHLYTNQSNVPDGGKDIGAQIPIFH